MWIKHMVFLILIDCRYLLKNFQIQKKDFKLTKIVDIFSPQYHENTDMRIIDIFIQHLVSLSK